MRKLLAIFGTLIALVVAFVVYFSMQSKFGFSANDKKGLDTFPETGLETHEAIKPGSGAWSKQFDRDGNLYYQFKCAYYDPQPDGTVKVTLPVIQFFLSDGQMMQIEGKTGSIRFPAGTDKGVIANSPTEPPRYGSLRDVVVKLFATVPKEGQDDPEMTMKMANAQFDNDTFRLFTQEYTDEHGKVVHEDDVPVTVEAKDYRFNGSGLVLYWNDVDKRLKSLQIAHGYELTLLDPQDFGVRNAEAPAPAAAAAPTTKRAAVAPATEPVASAAPAPAPRQRYTATFYNHVHVTQGGDDLVEAERMDVDFAAKGEHSGNESVAGKTPGATTMASASTLPSTRGPVAATQPKAEPIVIHWSGPLKMVPTDPATAEPLADGKAIVQLTGAPVRVHESGQQVGQAAGQTIDLRCENLRYHTEDSSAHLSGNIFIRQKKGAGPGSTVAGTDLVYSRTGRSAVFTGPGQTRMPDPNDPKSVLNAAWEKGCRVTFAETGSNQTEIEAANLQGNVRVVHPRFGLSARDDVQLSFADSAAADVKEGGSPPLREITADGDATCVVHEADNQDRWIKGQKLKLLREPGPDGKLYAREVNCTGSVRARQGDEDLSSESLVIDLLPTTRPSQPRAGEKQPTSEGADEMGGQVALERLVATKDVRVVGKDGSAARADNLEVQMVDDHPHVLLVGSAAQPAEVKNKSSTLTGPTIRFAPHEQTASVEGPGNVVGLQEASHPGEKARPMNVWWRDGASLDGTKNEVIVNGAVKARSAGDGDVETATCDRIFATLEDVAPTTQPAKKVMKSESVADGTDFMRNKQVKVLSLEAIDSGSATTRPTATVESSAYDPRGNLLHRYDLLSQRIDFSPGSRRVVVNGPGDIVAVEEAATGAGAATRPASAIGGTGNTVIDWQKRFVYDDTENSALIEGDIRIVHDGVGAKSQSVKLDHADVVSAEFYPEDKKKLTDPSGGPKLKSMIATGPMVIRTLDKTIYCGALNFDPADQILICDRGQLGKVTVVDNNNLSGGDCAEAIFDMKTNELKKMVNVTGRGQ